MTKIDRILSSEDAKKLTSHPDGIFKLILDCTRLILRTMGFSLGMFAPDQNKIKLNEDIQAIKNRLSEYKQDPSDTMAPL